MGSTCIQPLPTLPLTSTGLASAVGEVESLDAPLAREPALDLGFWKAWYLGFIQWRRQTVKPASVPASPVLLVYFDGSLTPTRRRRVIGRLQA